MKSLKHSLLLSLVALCFVFTSTLTSPINQSAIAFQGAFNYRSADPYIALAEQVDGNSAWRFVEKLVSDDFAGRLSGTEGADKSAEWIANVFQMYGLKPGGSKDEDSYFQPFNVPLYEIRRPTSLSIISKQSTEALGYNKDFTVMPFSGSGSIKAPVVFAGFGISNPSQNYEEYASIDVKDKIVVILRKAPAFSSFSDTHQSFTNKIKIAIEKGAKGILFADIPDEKNPYPMNMKPVYAHSSENMPIFFVSSLLMDKLLSSVSTDLRSIVTKIEHEQKPASMNLNVILDMVCTVSKSIEETSNVIGYLPARTETADSILITAHYDHLGLDHIDGSLYAGANDNASGTGTLMEIARAITHQCFTIDVNIVFIAFSGEEEGLIGSFHYVRNPLFPLKNILAVFNMDMVGTGNGSLLAGTSKTAYPRLHDAVKTSAEDLGINLVFDQRLLNSGSDHYPFHREKVPNVFFFRSNPEGLGGYHTPEDTLDTVDPKNLEETGRLVVLAMMELSEPLFMLVDSKDIKDTDIQKPYLRLYGLGNYAFEIEINHQKIFQGSNARFFHVVPLQEGQNLIHISMKLDEQLVFEKIISIKAKIIAELAGDFNDDFKVDMQDFRYLSQHFEKQINAIEDWSVCDLNRDGIINTDDVKIFQTYYGFQGD